MLPENRQFLENDDMPCTWKDDDKHTTFAAGYRFDPEVGWCLACYECCMEALDSDSILDKAHPYNPTKLPDQPEKPLGDDARGVACESDVADRVERLIEDGREPLLGRYVSVQLVTFGWLRRIHGSGALDASSVATSGAIVQCLAGGAQVLDGLGVLRASVLPIVDRLKKLQS